MPNQIPFSSVSMSFKDGKFELLIADQPFNMKLLQRVELVIDAGAMLPFVRLTVLPGDTGVSLGQSILEVKPGDPSKHTFDPAAPGHQPG